MRAKEGDCFWDTSNCTDSFERVNLKTYLDLLPGLSPIPKSAYGCCQYYTVIESFTESNQPVSTRKSLSIPQIQPACSSSWDPGQRSSREDLFIIMVNSQHGWDRKTLLRLNGSFSQPPDWAVPSPVQQGVAKSWQSPWRRVSHSSAHRSPRSAQTFWPRWLRQKGQGICYSPAYLFLCQMTT